MGTTFEQLECQAMTYIKNDLSLDWDLKNRLPVFYRRMWNYMQAAIPLFNKPPVMMTRLRKMTEPEYSDVLFTVSEVSEDSTVTIETGITEMDLCSAGIVTEDEFGNPQYLPLTVDSYDAETGTVIISGEIPVWRQPTGAQDAYHLGDKVHYPDAEGPVYISTVDDNVWTPGVYGWDEV